jgi:uncharacterized membrane protein
VSNSLEHSHHGGRVIAIDALRGLVMIIMLLDHTRERFFLQHAVSDPVDCTNTDLGLFLVRLMSSLCAPVFVMLAGLSAWYGSQKMDRRQTPVHLLKRGLLLILMELTLVGLPWYDSLPPRTIWLQVIWAIGVSMLALSALLHLPRKIMMAVALILICGHNLLDRIHFASNSMWFIPWAILHDRSVVELTDLCSVKTSYPVIPWIGVMAFGYGTGSWFQKILQTERRVKKLFCFGAFMLGGFALLRSLNFYGDHPWGMMDHFLRTIMSFLALTKYPPSLLFLLFTLGVGIVLLAWFVKLNHSPYVQKIAQFGSEPMFFYLLHLYALKAVSMIIIAFYGSNYGSLYVFDHLSHVWLMFLFMLSILYFPVCWYSAYKHRVRSSVVSRRD